MKQTSEITTPNVVNALHNNQLSALVNVSMAPFNELKICPESFPSMSVSGVTRVTLGGKVVRGPDGPIR